RRVRRLGRDALRQRMARAVVLLPRAGISRVAAARARRAEPSQRARRRQRAFRASAPRGGSRAAAARRDALTHRSRSPSNGVNVMNAKVIGFGLLAATVGAVLLSPAFRGNAALPPPPPVPVPATPHVQTQGAAKVEVVFVLDTTGSMSGLIDAAKEKIWSIAASMSQATPAPEISMGLVAYRDRGDAYVTQ